MSNFIYLASQSPRRQELLQQLGVKYQLLLPQQDEDAESLEQVLPSEAALHYVKRVTKLKLQAAVARRVRLGLVPAPILCADTTVALRQQILGKPKNEAHAIQMLTALAGQQHFVYTALSLYHDQQFYHALSESTVTFAAMTKQEIERYVATQEPFGKAGSYAVQGRAAAFISNIEGSYTGIMGLPLFECAQLLRQIHWPL